MEAVILAAGLGTRLRPHTESVPKPLLPVQGRPILDWILGAMPPEVDRVLIVVNYLADQIESYMRSQTWFTQWQTVPQGRPQGTGDAFRSCQPHLRSDRYLVFNGDDLYGKRDLQALARHDAGILVHPVDQPRQFGIVFTRPDGTVEKLVEKPALDGRLLANIGAYVFPRRVFDYELQLSPRGEYEITDYVIHLLSTGPFHAVQANFWFPIGTIEAWRRAEELDLSSESDAS